MNALAFARNRLLAPVFGLALTVVAPLSQAAQASASATIDWGTLTIAQSGPLLLVPMGDSANLVNAAALLNSDLTIAELAQSVTEEVYVSGLNTTFGAAAGNVLEGTSASALSDDGGLVLGASRLVQNYWVFGNGAISFSVNYSITAEKTEAEGAAFAFSRLMAVYYANSDSQPQFGLDSDSVFLDYDDDLTYTFDSGILSVVLSIGADGPGSFLSLRAVTFAAANTAPVPLPATLPILLSGIAGLLAVRSRSRAALAA